MEETLACRLCLSTNTKLFNIFKHRLHTVYRTFTGVEIASTDGIPPYICSLCSTLLIKSTTFKQMCVNSHELLQFALIQQVLSTEYIKNLQSSSPYTLSTIKNKPVTCSVFQANIKEEAWPWVDDDDHKFKETESSDDDVSVNTVNRSEANDYKVKEAESSDEEPLSTKVKKTESTKVEVKLEEVLNAQTDIKDDDFPNGEVDEMILTKEEQIEEVQLRKTSTNYLNSFYKCEKCYKGFMTDATYKNHMVRHDPSSGVHECEICHIRLSHMRALRAHVASSHERKFLCKLCNHVSKSSFFAANPIHTFKSHTALGSIVFSTVRDPPDTVQNEYYFGRCATRLKRILQSFEFTADQVWGKILIGNWLDEGQHEPDCVYIRSQSLADASVKYNAQKFSFCLCTITYNAEGVTTIDHYFEWYIPLEITKDVDWHKAKEHSKWHTGHTFICKICGASFSKSTSHLSHIRSRHPSKHACLVCGEAFIGENGLNMHRRKAHRDLVNSELDIDTRCSNCDTQFHSIEALKRHTANAEDGLCDLSNGLRPCHQCGEGYPNEEELKEHLKVHTKDGKVTCEECNRIFAHERSYAVHYQRVHLKLRGFKDQRKTRNANVVCEICGRECTSSATLRYHQRTHTGERPYACAACPKRFSQPQRLQIHQRTHTGERPFKCASCPKAFKHKAALNRHNRVHTGAKPYACSHCGKSFSQSNSMKVHIRTVHLKLPSPYRARRTAVE